MKCICCWFDYYGRKMTCKVLLRSLAFCIHYRNTRGEKCVKMKFIKSHPTKLYISQNTEGTWFVKLGEKKRNLSRQKISIFSYFQGQLSTFFCLQNLSGDKVENVPNYIIWSFFFSFWWFWCAKNLIDGHIYFIWGRGDRWKVTNVCGPRLENNLWLKIATKASHFYEISKGKDLGFMWQSLKFCAFQVTMNISA